METACNGDGLLGRSGREMKLPVERIYSTNWWNRTDGYSTVHFAVLASFWRVASDERVPLVISPKPLDIYIWSRMWTRACTSDAFVQPHCAFEDRCTGMDRRWKIFSHRWKPLGWSFPLHRSPGGIDRGFSRSYFFFFH